MVASSKVASTFNVSKTTATKATPKTVDKASAQSQRSSLKIYETEHLRTHSASSSKRSSVASISPKRGSLKELEQGWSKKLTSPRAIPPKTTTVAAPKKSSISSVGSEHNMLHKLGENDKGKSKELNDLMTSKTSEGEKSSQQNVNVSNNREVGVSKKLDVVSEITDPKIQEKQDGTVQLQHQESMEKSPGKQNMLEQTTAQLIT